MFQILEHADDPQAASPSVFRGRGDDVVRGAALLPEDGADGSICASFVHGEIHGSSSEAPGRGIAGSLARAYALYSMALKLSRLVVSGAEAIFRMFAQLCL